MNEKIAKSSVKIKNMEKLQLISLLTTLISTYW
jgi:hypothetical protein